MRINKLTVFFLLPVVLFLSACNDAEEDTATKTKTTAVKDEFEGIEVLFNEEEHFSAPNTVELLKEINKQAAKNNRVIDCLLQIYIAEEESKFGLDEQELDEILKQVQHDKENFKNIRIVGLMGMATFTENQNQIEKEFKHLKTIFDKVATRKDAINRVSILSMGMSGDYQLAISCGSTMVRIGSSIFGSR